jgi:hypothetical protein
LTSIEFKLGGVLTFITEPSKAGALITLHYGAFTLTARGDQMAYTLPDGFQIGVKVSYVDAQGNPARVDGDVTWESSNIDIATVTATGPDAATVAATVGGTIGQLQITAKADADLGQGVRELITTMDVEVVAGEAVAGTIAPVGEATPQGARAKRR